MPEMTNVPVFRITHDLLKEMQSESKEIRKPTLSEIVHKAVLLLTKENEDA